MKKTDYHIHTDFSADSNIKLEELMPYALKKGFSEIVVTEHLDLSPQEITVYGLPSLIKYKSAIKHFQSQYPELKLYCGIEVGDYQDVKTYADTILEQIKFDLILGSVHFINNRINVAIPLKKALTSNDILNYYEQNLRLAESCNINVLAHLGVYKRYYETTPDESYCLPIIKKIFEVMIDKGIALEINYSAFRRNYMHLHPETEHLLLYKKIGGKLVTIGSDSHKLEQFGDYYNNAYNEMIKFGFEHLIITP